MSFKRDFGGQALSLYNYYLERGLTVTLQLWSTQDGGQHCKISCPPIQHLCPPTQPIRQHKLVNHKSPCRRRRDLKRMEQRRRAQGVGNKLMELETSFKELETKFKELKTKFMELETNLKELETKLKELEAKTKFKEPELHN